MQHVLHFAVRRVSIHSAQFMIQLAKEKSLTVAKREREREAGIFERVAVFVQLLLGSEERREKSDANLVMKGRKAG